MKSKNITRSVSSGRFTYFFLHAERLFIPFERKVKNCIRKWKIQNILVWRLIYYLKRHATLSTMIYFYFYDQFRKTILKNRQKNLSSRFWQFSSFFSPKLCTVRGCLIDRHRDCAGCWIVFKASVNGLSF